MPIVLERDGSVKQIIFNMETSVYPSQPPRKLKLSLNLPRTNQFLKMLPHTSNEIWILVQVDINLCYI